MLENAGEGSSAGGCSELEAGDVDIDNDRDWLLLLLVSLLKTDDWLLPVLWMGLEVQSSPGCFFWMSAVKDDKKRKKEIHQTWRRYKQRGENLKAPQTTCYCVCSWFSRFIQCESNTGV